MNKSWTLYLVVILSFVFCTKEDYDAHLLIIKNASYGSYEGLKTAEYWDIAGGWDFISEQASYEIKETTGDSIFINEIKVFIDTSLR